MRKKLLALLFVLSLIPAEAGAYLSQTASKSTTFSLTFGQTYNLSSYNFSYLTGLASKTSLLQARTRTSSTSTRSTTGRASSPSSGFNPTMIQPVGDPKGN